METLASCVFCEIVAGRMPATLVASDETAIAFLDVRQFHPGHVLVIPRAHVSDIRTADDKTLAAVVAMVARVSRAVDRACPADGLSVWHSAGEGANQEVPHLHFHVHPRRLGDDLLRIYPRLPECPDRSALDTLGAGVRTAMVAADPPGPADAQSSP